jgi:hypothetical protein
LNSERTETPRASTFAQALVVAKQKLVEDKYLEYLDEVKQLNNVKEILS